MRFAAVALLAALIALPARAVQPDELLADPQEEARARDISAEIRCLVCRNESIDDSNADLARDLRLVIRERIVAGDSNDEVKEFLVDRYGEFVLLKPPFSASNAALWLAGPVLFLLGGAMALAFLRRQRHAPATGERPLSEDEKAALARILDQDRDRAG
ncbi:MAG: cytochrome c-type biogenesis protein [Pikeienuella sp.]